jgi:hypothetical protein
MSKPRRKPAWLGILAALLASLVLAPLPLSAAGWLDSLVRHTDPLLGERPYLEASPPPGLLQLRSEEAPFAEKIPNPLAAGRYILHAALSRDGSLLAFSDSAGMAALVRADSGALLIEESFEGNPPVFLDFSPDGWWLLMAPVPAKATNRQPPSLLFDLKNRRRIELRPSIRDWGFSPDSTTLAYSYSADYGHDSIGGSYVVDLATLDERESEKALELGLLPAGKDFTRVGLRALDGGRLVHRLAPSDREERSKDSRVRIVVEELRSGNILRAEAFDLAAFVQRPLAIDPIKAAMARVKPGKPSYATVKAEVRTPDDRAESAPPKAADSLPPLPRLTDYGSWHLIETRVLGDQRIDLLSEDAPDYGDGWQGLRVVLRDSSGLVLRDRVIPAQGLESLGSGSNWYARINDEGRILVLPTEWSEDSRFIIIDASLETAVLGSFDRVDSEDRGYVLHPSGDGFFLTGHEYRLAEGSWLAYSLGSSSASLFRPAEEPAWYGDGLATVAVTAHHYILWGEGFRSSSGEGEEHLSGAMIFKTDGSFETELIFREGQSDLRLFHVQAVWEGPDGGLVFAEAATCVEADDRKLNAPTVRVARISPEGKLATKLLRLPWAGLEDLSDSQALVDRGGLRLVPYPGRGGWGGYEYRRPPTIRMAPFKRDAAGRPDPLQGFDQGLWIDDPLFAQTDDSKVGLGFAGAGGYLLTESFESRGNPTRNGLLELPLAPNQPPPAPSALRDLSPPELSITPWVDYERVAVPVRYKPSDLLVDTPLVDRSGTTYALPLSRASSGSGEDVAVLNDSAVGLRSKPSTTGDLLLKLDKGAMVLVLERGSGIETIGTASAPWYRVRTADGLEGWLFAAFLDERRNK